MFERIEGDVEAQESPIGYLPHPEDIDTDGLATSTEDVAAALRFDADEWRQELPLIKEWFAKFGDDLPSAMEDELATLEERLAGADA